MGNEGNSHNRKQNNYNYRSKEDLQLTTKKLQSTIKSIKILAKTTTRQLRRKENNGNTPIRMTNKKNNYNRRENNYNRRQNNQYETYYNTIQSTEQNRSPFSGHKMLPNEQKSVVGVYEFVKTTPNPN